VTTTSSPHAAERTGRHVPGEEGLWVFVLGDMVVFALFFATVVVTSVHHPAAVSQSQDQLHVSLGLGNTVILLLGSLLAIHGTNKARRGLAAATWCFGATALCGVAFAAIKVTEYAMLLETGVTPGQNPFFINYFVFTFIHLAHLVIGVALMVILSVVTRAPSTEPRRLRLVEVGAVYWHMVDLLWLILFPLLYLVRQ